jgi:hypothetical protein
MSTFTNPSSSKRHQQAVDLASSSSSHVGKKRRTADDAKQLNEKSSSNAKIFEANKTSFRDNNEAKRAFKVKW